MHRCNPTASAVCLLRRLGSRPHDMTAHDTKTHFHLDLDLYERHRHSRAYSENDRAEYDIASVRAAVLASATSAPRLWHACQQASDDECVSRSMSHFPGLSRRTLASCWDHGFGKHGLSILPGQASDVECAVRSVSHNDQHIKTDKSKTR